MNIRLPKGDALARSHLSSDSANGTDRQETLLWFGVVFLAVLVLVLVGQVRGVFLRKDLPPGSPAVALLETMRSMRTMGQIDGLKFFSPVVPASLRQSTTPAYDVTLGSDEEGEEHAITFKREEYQDTVAEAPEDSTTQKLLGGNNDSDAEWDVEQVRTRESK